MIAVLTIYRPGAEPEVREEDWPEQPGYRFLREKLAPLLDGGEIERVNVFWEGRYMDMFVDETGSLQGLARNEAATALYRNNWLTHVDPEASPETLPAIYGVAVFCDRRVWS